jgi:hypothetical protein
VPKYRDAKLSVGGAQALRTSLELHYGELVVPSFYLFIPEKMLISANKKMSFRCYGKRIFLTTLVGNGEPEYLSGIALGYGLDDRGFESRQGLGIFSTASRPALWPTQPPTQWVSGALSLGVKRQGSEVDHSPPSRAEVKNAWSYNSTPPIRLHGVVLS